MSEEKRTIDAKLAEIMAEVRLIAFDAKNDFQKYKYASAKAVLSKVNEGLSSRGLSIENKSSLLRYDVNEKGSHNAIIHLRMTINDGESGETRSFEGIGSGADKGDKAVMKATTAAHKYAYAMAFCISWGDDPEGSSPGGSRGRAGSPKGKTMGKATPVESSIEGAFSDIANGVDIGKTGVLAYKEDDRYIELRNAYKAQFMNKEEK